MSSREVKRPPRRGEHELMATNEQLAQARDTIEEMRHKEEQMKSQMGDVEAREVALKGKFDQWVPRYNAIVAAVP